MYVIGFMKTNPNHMLFGVFLNVFKDTSIHGYLFPEYLLHILENLSYEFHTVLLSIKEYTVLFMWQCEIQLHKMYDVAKIWSWILMA